MVYPYRILFAIALGVFGYIAVCTEIRGYESGLFSSFNYFAFFVFILVGIGCFFYERQFYKQTGKLKEYILSIPVALLIFFVFYKIIYRESINKRKTVLQVFNMPKPKHVISFEFKTGHHFRLIESDLFGRTYYYGKYSMTGSEIRILKSNHSDEKYKLPKIGYIRNDTVFWQNFDTMLIDKSKPE